MFDVPESYIDEMEDVDREEHRRFRRIRFEVESNEERSLIQCELDWHWVSNQGMHGWFGDSRTRCMRLNKTQFLLVCWPEINIRPFPEEYFHIQVSINGRNVAKIPLRWYK